jgi:hypothetical protein
MTEDFLFRAFPARECPGRCAGDRNEDDAGVPRPVAGQDEGSAATVENGGYLIRSAASVEKYPITQMGSLFFSSGPGNSSAPGETKSA